ncbi:MAG: RNA methyltransferase [Clostridia bacterium]|nr:RNA methyltransferase [Clostridia bacterium]NCC44447.1 RNA methyltransferase [Clostridia bacterium]
MITSTSNAQVKQVMLLSRKSRERKKQDVFLVEGTKMFGEAPKSSLVRTYVSESFTEKAEYPQIIGDTEHEVVKDSVFAQMSDTPTPQGILAVVRQFHYELDKMIQSEKKPLFLVLEDLQDPGNVGTIFRTAEGAGVTGIIMTKNCVDIYHPKTIRSTMGSIYRLPFLCVDTLDEVLDWFADHGISTYAAHLGGKHFYDEEDYTGGSAFFIGNEGNGLTDELTQKADHLIKIPMEGRLESLNAGVASAILMYEAFRQRRRSM